MFQACRRTALRAVACAAAVMLLAACAPVTPRADRSRLLVEQEAREQLLAPHQSWTIEARLGVSDGEDGGSGNLTWVERPERYDFTLRGPVTARSFHLFGDATGVVLEGLEDGPLHGASAQRLLARVFGWRMPLAELRYWVRGMRAPGSPATIEFGANGLPQMIRQQGWAVEYREWFETTDPALPQKVFAEKGPYRVRVSIRRWELL